MDNEAMRESLEFMLENMELIKRTTELNAVLTRVAYNALIETGFSEPEAFELVARKGVMLG